MSGQHKTAQFAIDASFNILRTISYLMMYYGSIFTDNYKIAMLYGSIAIICYCIIIIINIYLIKNNNQLIKKIIPWFLLSSGTVLFSLLISQTRFFLKPPTNTIFISFGRYNHLTVLFWLGLIIPLIVIISSFNLKPIRKKFLTLFIIISILICICIPLYLNGLQQYKIVKNRYRYSEHANLSLQTEIFDDKELNNVAQRIASPKPLHTYIPYLKKLSHVPYDKILIEEYKYDSILDATLTQSFSNDQCGGSIDSSKQLNKNSVKISGAIDNDKLYKGDMSIKHILIVNDNGHIRGAGLIDTIDKKSWYGYAKLPENSIKEENIFAYARLRNGKLYKFAGMIKLKYFPTFSKNKQRAK